MISLTVFEKLRSRVHHAEMLFLLMMLFALLVPSHVASITPWNQISFPAILRGVIWLLGLCLFPGLYLLRLANFGTELTREIRYAVAICLSFIIVGVVTLVFYCFDVDYVLLPWLMWVLLYLMLVTKWFRNPPNQLKVTGRISKWRLLLVVIVALSVLLSCVVQISQRYLIAGDMWLSLNPAVEAISRRNVYQAFSSWEYPIMFGFMLGGMSICSGLSVVNAYVLLFPLMALNVLSFFAVSRVLFKQDEKISTIASFVYCFGGGLALLYQILVSSSKLDFWTTSFQTMDAYFSWPFWNGIQFFYKTLALALAFVGSVTLVTAVRSNERRTQVTGLVFTALMLWTSFLVHVVEFLFFVPIIIVIVFVCQKGKRSYVQLGLLGVFIALFAYITDFMMAGYYSWLIGKKMQGFLVTLRVTTFTYVFVGAIVVTLGAFAGWRILTRRVTTVKEFDVHRLKYVLVFGLGLVYFSGLFFWSTPSTGVSYPFPWYLYVTRYGFLGFLALIGFAAVSLREESFRLAGYWGAIAVIMGSIWWGERLNSFLFPIVAIFSAIGLVTIWKLADVTIRFPTLGKGVKSIGRNLKLGRRHLAATLILILLVCSVSSFTYGFYFYITSGPSIDDDVASAFAWIQRNTPENATILVPDIYQVSRGVTTIADRHIYVNEGLFSGFGADKFLSLTRALDQLNIRYALDLNESRGHYDLLNFLMSYSSVAYQQGRIKIYELPPIKSTSPEYSTAVVDQQSLGLRTDDASFGWVDDAFTTGWYYKEMNISRQEGLLAFSWDFSGSETAEPSARKTFPIVNTSKYPYVIVRYRNTLNTSDTAENNIGQMVTLTNETGYPQGYIANEYLPVSRGSSFNIFVARLPENQNIASVILWMRNYQKLNGTIGLQIDYMCFSSDESRTILEDKMSFLSMAVPALWPCNYSIVSDRGETKNTPIAVSLYDTDALNYTRESTATRTYVFLNESAEAPSWGASWINLGPGIVSGAVGEKRVIIIGVDSVRNNLLEIANSIYNQISVQG